MLARVQDPDYETTDRRRKSGRNPRPGFRSPGGRRGRLVSHSGRTRHTSAASIITRSSVLVTQLPVVTRLRKRATYGHAPVPGQFIEAVVPLSRFPQEHVSLGQSPYPGYLEHPLSPLLNNLRQHAPEVIRHTKSDRIEPIRYSEKIVICVLLAGAFERKSLHPMGIGAPDCNATRGDIWAHARVVFEACADLKKGTVAGSVVLNVANCPANVTIVHTVEAIS
jgi:hypothetical protein